ncbi:MAG: 50S ribosomal protein L10 [Gemmatimonadales bacterium]|jgi:large subunit ribosomal protein L10|nr:MAG: 50S ribosomal protein L10 [Gemmatimonadales bacterium]
MSKTERQAMVETLAEELERSPNLYLTDFTGMDVLRITEFRSRLRQAGVRYRVVKNTLMQRALADSQVSGLDEHLAGPTGLVLAGDDPITAAKVLADFIKEHERPALKIGLVDGQTMTPAEITHLASLPPRDVLLSQFAGALQAPMAQFAGIMNGLLYQFVGALEALSAQRGAAS